MMTGHGKKHKISAGAKKVLVCLLLPLLLAVGYAGAAAAPVPEQAAGAEEVPDYSALSGKDLLYAVREDAQGAKLLALIDALAARAEETELESDAAQALIQAAELDLFNVYWVDADAEAYAPIAATLRFAQVFALRDAAPALTPEQVSGLRGLVTSEDIYYWYSLLDAAALVPPTAWTAWLDWLRDGGLITEDEAAAWLGQGEALVPPAPPAPPPVTGLPPEVTEAVGAEVENFVLPGENPLAGYDNLNALGDLMYAAATPAALRAAYYTIEYRWTEEAPAAALTPGDYVYELVMAVRDGESEHLAAPGQYTVHVVAPEFSPRSYRLLPGESVYEAGLSGPPLAASLPAGYADTRLGSALRAAAGNGALAYIDEDGAAADLSDLRLEAGAALRIPLTPVLFGAALTPVEVELQAAALDFSVSDLRLFRGYTLGEALGEYGFDPAAGIAPLVTAEAARPAYQETDGDQTAWAEAWAQALPDLNNRLGGEKYSAGLRYEITGLAGAATAPWAEGEETLRPEDYAPEADGAYILRADYTAGEQTFALSEPDLALPFKVYSGRLTITADDIAPGDLAVIRVTRSTAGGAETFFATLAAGESKTFTALAYGTYTVGGAWAGSPEKTVVFGWGDIAPAAAARAGRLMVAADDGAVGKSLALSAAQPPAAEGPGYISGRVWVKIQFYPDYKVTEVTRP
ncbi:MAG: hypothetical protein LBS10_05255 [Gracilibacteraceae bacterium]|jgi:hypothetical protein|nr:hypothetical protein [Gracilibacteraceae bacterium]